MNLLGSGPVMFNFAKSIALILCVFVVSSAESQGESRPLSPFSPVPSAKSPGFTSMPIDQTHIDFRNNLSPRNAQLNRLLVDGSGVAAGDADGDGWCDLYFCSMDGPNRFYRNLGGWQFEEITDLAGVACRKQFSTGAVFADLNGDNDLDLLVNAMDRSTRCFLNKGNGRFAETSNGGFVKIQGSRSFALADVDLDGDLDIYVTHYRGTTAKDNPVSVPVTSKDGKLTIPVKHHDQFVPEMTPDGKVGLLEIGEPDQLYFNDGQANFSAVSWTQGRFLDEHGNALNEAPRDWGLAAMFRDVNRDGLPDLYVCNDFFTPDRFWINQGEGRFRALSQLALRKTSWASMAVDFADLNRDGHDDFLVADMLSRSHLRRQVQRSLVQMTLMPNWGWGWQVGDIGNRVQSMRNTLLVNRGDTTFAEIGQFAGVHASEWTWGVAFMDVDLDGYEDLLVANGHVHDLANSDVVAELDRITRAQGPNSRARREFEFPPLHLANLLFRNRGDLTFEEVSRDWGIDQVGACNGMALADLDNDGDCDVVLNNLNGSAVVLRNNARAARVAVRLQGATGNTQGIGARITVRGGPVTQSQEVICAGRYLSADDPLRVFAAGDEDALLEIEVRWPGGKLSRVRQVRANRLVVISETTAEDAELVQPQAHPATSLFRDVSELINHRHHEPPFTDESNRQALLPRGMSQRGPGVGWCDLNGDGRDDLVIGTGNGGLPYVLLNNRRGGFRWLKAKPWMQEADADLMAVVGWIDDARNGTLLLSQSGYEDGANRVRPVLQFRVWPGGVNRETGLEMGDSGGGAIAVTELHGKLMVFVAGAVQGGAYPQTGPSRLFVREGRDFVPQPELNRALSHVGLVNGAIWSDLNGDSLSELVLACEWGPLRVFEHRTDQLVEVTSEWGLQDEHGWWQGIAAGDFDGDGRLDLVAGNWGINHRYQGLEQILLYHGDLDGDGRVELIEAFHNEAAGQVVPWADRRQLNRALPAVAARIETYAAYAQSSLEQVLGPDAMARAQRLHADTLASALFLNRGGTFERRELPVEAQWSPALGVNVADFNGDGHEDIFLSQNWFAVDVETSRFDAGRGLLLSGDGTGGLTPVSAEASGIAVYGEQRGSAVADFDADGRCDLAVTQNGAATKLFRNQTARRGLRVRLQGGSVNTPGFGASMRLVYASGKQGPVREVHGGSGYLSQDSAIQILGAAEPVSALWIRWPGGKVQHVAIPEGTTYIDVKRE